MNRTTRNAGAALLVTALTCLAIFATVQTTARLAGLGQTTYASADTGSAATSGTAGTLTCPRTGCTASACHATTGGGSASGSGGNYGQGPGGGYGSSSGSNGSYGSDGWDSNDTWQ